MDFHLLNEFAKERIHEFQNSDPPITPFYSPFNSHWKPRIAKYFYLLAMWTKKRRYHHMVSSEHHHYLVLLLIHLVPFGHQ